MENELFMSMLPTWHSLDILPPELNTSSSSSGGQSPADCFFSPYRDKLNDNPFKFESVSALSSLSSSPVSPPTPVHPATHDSSVIRELIGKLENSPKWGNFNSALNSGTANFSANPRFSGFGSRSFNGRTSRFGLNHCEFPNTMPELTAIGKRVSRVLSSPSLKEPEAQLGDLVNKNFQKEDRAELSHCHEDSSISNPDKVPAGEVGVNLRKRKSAHRGKVAEVENDSNPKRAKQSEGNGNENGVMKTEEEIKGGGCNGTDAAVEEKETNNDSKPTEPPKDYIHVRARRGQATDSHSLAERVRREKISERMKLLQDLVPGCNKVTGKALMLDEIINYVQSLQRQVEFLSMKLSSVNSSVNNMDFNVEAPMMKDVLFQSENTVPPAHPILPLDSSASAFYGQKNPAVNSSNGTIPHCPVDPHQFPPLALDGLNQHVLPYENFCGDDLHSIVQMGFGQSAAFNLQSFHGRNDSSCMKIEL